MTRAQSSDVENHMLLILGGLAASIALVLAVKVRAAVSEHANPLGWMSDEWLAERRAAQYH